MADYAIGSIIRNARERQKYSQEELSFGICTASTLSRIENGLQAPGKKILEALMQRLGLVDRVYNSYLTPEEMERYEAEERLMRCLAKEDYAQAQEIAAMLEERFSKIHKKNYNMKLEEQYVCFARTLIRKNQGENARQILEQLMMAIHMTIPDFDGMHIRQRLLTFYEISILNNIGCIYHAMGDSWNAIRLLYELKDYIEEHTADGQKISVKYLMILQNLSIWMSQEEHNQEALNLCQKGIDYCIEYGKLHAFPFLLCNKACVLAKLGQYDVSEEIFYQTVAILKATGQHERAGQVRKYAEQSYGIKV